MKHIFRLLNGALGVVMIAAAFALGQLPWIEIAQAPTSDAFRLIQFHFVLTGAFSLWSISTAKREGFLVSFSLLILGVNAWLLFLALTASDATLLWPAVFAVVSAVNFAYLLATDVSVEPQAISTDPDSDKEDDKGLVSPDFGVVKAGGQLNSAAFMTGMVALQVGLTIALLFFGAIYVRLLRTAIFDKGDISFSRVMENLTDGAANEGLLRIGISVVVIVIVYGAVFLVEAVINLLLKKKAAVKFTDVDRDLSRDERVYIRQSLNSLAAYLETRLFQPRWGWLHAIGVVAMIASFIAAPAAVIFIETMIGAALKDGRALNAEPLSYSGTLYIGGVVGGFFAGAGLFWSLYQYLGARIPEFGEYLFAQAGWNSLNNGARSLADHLRVLVRQVRERALDVGRPFEPFAFLCAAFRERESLIYKITAWAIVSTFFLAAADIARFELVDGRGVTYSKYLEFRTQHVRFDDLDRIEVRCILYAPDKKGHVNLGLDYTLVKDGEFRIDMLSEDDDDLSWLDRLEALDRKLTTFGVPIARADSAGLLQGKKSSFVAECNDEIGERYPAEVASRFSRILRVDRFADAPQN